MSPNDPLSPLVPEPYPLVTKSFPLKSVSLVGLLREALCTNKYSVAKPVPLIFFADNISFATNPPTLATYIVVSEAPTNPPKEPDSTVEFATYN